MEDLRKEIHMKMLAKSENAKNCGELTVIPLGHAVTIAEALIAQREKLARESERHILQRELNYLRQFQELVIRKEEMKTEPIILCGMCGSKVETQLQATEKEGV